MNQPAQQQNPPGTEQQMRPAPDHGEASYQGSGRLTGKAAVVTGADSGIGKAVAIAFAREGADVVISYLDEHEDAEDTRKWVEDAGRKAVLVPGDLTDAAHCRAVIDRAVQELGRVDILVSNAAFQATHQDLTEIGDEEWDPMESSTSSPPRRGGSPPKQSATTLTMRLRPAAASSPRYPPRALRCRCPISARLWQMWGS